MEARYRAVAAPAGWPLGNEGMIENMLPGDLNPYRVLLDSPLCRNGAASLDVIVKLMQGSGI